MLDTILAECDAWFNSTEHAYEEACGWWHEEESPADVKARYEDFTYTDMGRRGVSAQDMMDNYNSYLPKLENDSDDSDDIPF